MTIHEAMNIWRKYILWLAIAVALVLPVFETGGWARMVANEYYQFQMDVPEDWVSRNDLRVEDVFSLSAGIDDEAASGRAFAYFPENYEETNVSAILLVKKHRSPITHHGRTAKGMQRRYEKFLKEMNEEIEIENLKLLTHGPREAIQFEISFPSTQGRLKQLRYLTSGQKFHYVLMMSAPEDVYEQYTDTFSSLIESLHVTPPQKQPMMPEGSRKMQVERYILPALFMALLLGWVIRAWRTSSAIRKQ